MKRRALSLGALAERRARVAAELERAVEGAAKRNERVATLSAEVGALDRALVARDRRLDRAASGRFTRGKAAMESAALCGSPSVAAYGRAGPNGGHRSKSVSP